jgi:hypothetical protein
MEPNLMISAFLIFFLLIQIWEAHAVDLTGMGGIMHSWNSVINDSSYSWQLEYREELSKRFAESF